MSDANDITYGTLTFSSMKYVEPDAWYHFHNSFTKNPINNDDKDDTTPVGTTKYNKTKRERRLTTNYTSSLKRREKHSEWNF